MNVILQNIGRRFNREWIFKNIDYTFTQGDSYAVLGPNGSGKSTLLQVIAGSLTPSQGTIRYGDDEKPVADEQVFAQLSLAAPYLELVEEFTLRELVDFHFRFKNYREGFDAQKVIGLLGFGTQANKMIRHFSSGMKQRTKLALAFCADTPLILLDEPGSNLDEAGLAWYHQLVTQFSPGRLLIIGSNQEPEYHFCKNRLQVTDFKA
ncbi:ABC transporter ATP-binding protein [Hufsiella ginkgonis]|uniref:ATP-binding cassette domain-containing protein n=1 Tax=Hufsiella ginkgonis TaxID=2695274 RepID=A0A7K1XVU2_9SPHI|nr:ATP-binding cassette domain-containing protein [Hufsiella ginkgonis]MXV14889.1 ATP-binding cassette domain-containing protein [Hufsiella ginkgonis]